MKMDRESSFLFTLSGPYDKKSLYPKLIDSQGSEIPFVVAFGFAWQAFYPKTLIWKD